MNLGINVAINIRDEGIIYIINYDYLFDKSHYDLYTKTDHFSQINLMWREYENATVLPFSYDYKEAAGVYVRDRYKSLIEGIVNLVFSLILVQKYGICGVIAGTIIAELSIAVWVEAKAFRYFVNMLKSIYKQKYKRKS